MPEFSISTNYPPGMSQEELINSVAKMSKTLNWLLNQMDSLNIPRINTNITQIKSKDGETYINGPVLEQYDSSGTLRLKQGLDTSDNTFLFNMYDEDGDLTIYLDSNGEAVFAGNIQTSKNATIGEILKLVSPTTTYNSGIQWIAPDETTVLARQLFITDTLYTNNYLGDIDMLAAGGMILRATGGNISLDPGTAGVQLKGKLAFFGDIPTTKDSVANLSPTATLDETISKLNELIDALQSYNLV